MSRQRIADGQDSFAGGLNTVSDPWSVAPSQFRLGRNARHTEYGALTKRFGSVSFASTNLPAAPFNGFSWVRANGLVGALVVGIDGRLYGRDALAVIGASGWVTITASPQLSQTVVPTFAEFVDGTGAEVVYIGDGGRINKWDGTTFTPNIGAGPAVRFLKVHNQRLWSCGCGVAPSSIFYSDLNNGDTIGDVTLGGGEIVVRTFGDEKIVALASVGSSLLIFHERGLSRLTGFGQDDINVDPEGISSQTGTIAPFSVVETDGAAFFVSDRGVFVATESNVTALNTPNRPDPLLPVIATLTPDQLAGVRAVLSRKTQEVWFLIPGYGAFVYHLVLNAWSGPWTGEYETATCLWGSRVGTFAEEHVIMGMFDTAVRVVDMRGIGTDGATLAAPSSGSTILWRVQLRRLSFNDESEAKSLRFAYATLTVAGNQPIEVSWITNFGEYPPQTLLGMLQGVWADSKQWLDSLTWPSGFDSQNYRIGLSGVGNYVDFTLTHDGVDTPILSRFKLDAFVLGRR
jgi:hypothetical protein